jgi:mRNA-degrading endonuclease RelE of RelBE toxin-antitoxin system
MPYLISYVAVGLLLALASALRNSSPPSSNLGRSLLILCLWPVLLFLAPECFTGNKSTEMQVEDEAPDSVFLELKKLSSQDIDALSDEERIRLNRVAKAEELGTTFFSDYEDFEDVLNRFWDDAVPPEAYHPLNEARWHLSDDYEVDSGIRFSLREPDWYIGFSAEFVKSIAKIDKNKRARVLEAISKLAEAPITPHGDTIKPLTGDLAGLWRYRIGDDRLVYKANSQSQKIVLVSFGARGGVYE